MKSVQLLSRQTWFLIAILFVVTALTYLPLVNKIGYLNDDWYLMYDASTQGSQFLHEVWRSDRPGRALFMIPLFELFGTNPLPYHISMFVFRFFGGISLLWVLRMLWPKRYFFTISAAILFTIYSGFLSQTNAIDYQSHILALFLAVISIALTIRSVLTPSLKTRSLLTGGSILLGWLYLSQMEYFIGLEVFRLAILLMLVLRKKQVSLWQTLTRTFFQWLPFATIPMGFLAWRLFFFEADRRAIDVGFQLGQLFSSPLAGLWWLVYLIQDVFEVMLVAWGYPLYTIANQMRLRDTLIGFGLSVLAVVVVGVGLNWGKQEEMGIEERSSSGWMREEYWVGLATIIGGLIPIILANRHVSFPDYSRYTLPASIGVVIVMAAIIDQLTSYPLRVMVVSFFVAVSVLIHHANAVRAVNDTEVIRDFWWQVSWRAPQIREGTTLVASYPGVGIQEDYFIWGPANFIYYPYKQDQVPIEIKLPAAVLTNDVVLNIMTGKGTETPERRGNIFTRNFDEVLFIVQTSKDSCVRVIDGNAPDLSSLDSHRTMLVAEYSQIDRVITDVTRHIPPQVVFGDEPLHEWCYYYQQASLARQNGEWEKISEIYKEALKLGLYPNDSVEWMPFTQAFMVLGDQDKLRILKKIIISDPYLTDQTCKNLTGMFDTYTIQPEIQTFVQQSFCE